MAVAFLLILARFAAAFLAAAPIHYALIRNGDHSNMISTSHSQFRSVGGPTADIAVVGRFWAFDLAKQMQRHGMLGTLLSTYPTQISRRWGIDRTKLRGEPLLEVLRRYGGKQPLVDTNWLNLFLSKRHGSNARQMIRASNADIFIGWSGSSLEALLEARASGQLTILERGSSHCNEWRALMRHENALLGRSFDDMPSFWQRELLEYELADYIAIPSEFARESFIRHGVPEHKLLVNAYGVDLSSFRQVAKEDDKFRIINVGGLHARKGAQYLLQAISELKDLDIEFWHVGSVSTETHALIKRYADDRFTFHGHKPQNELYKFYSQASIFTIASIEDGFGMVIPQAMACGLPVICTTNTGGADLIGEDGEVGYIVPIRDVSALKKRIQYLYENQHLAQEMGQRAKARVASGLTWDDYGDRYADNIRRCVAQHRLQNSDHTQIQWP